VVDGRGRNAGGQVASETDLRDLVAQAPADGRVVAITRHGVAPDLSDTWRTCCGVDRSPDVRPLTGPYLVPDGWGAPIGAPGQIVGRFHGCRDVREGDDRLVLATWRVDGDGLRHFVDVLDAQIAVGDLTTTARVRTLLERPIRMLGGTGPPLRYANGLRALEQTVDAYEESFRDGADFTREQHLRIEQLLQELVMHKAAFPTVGMETERLGLESRMVRLLDAQAMRDANGALGRIISVLTALVLVPTLITGVFSSAVPLPFQHVEAMRRAMFAFMACGGVLTYLLLLGVRQSASTRRFVWRLPGAFGPVGSDAAAWNARRGFAALSGAALGVNASALQQLWTSGAPGIRESTTMATVAICVLALATVLVALFVEDVEQRSGMHAATDVAGAVVASLAAVALLDSRLLLGVIALAGGAALRVAPSTRRAGDALDDRNKGLKDQAKSDRLLI
jgi:hypothetical protein